MDRRTFVKLTVGTSLATAITPVWGQKTVKRPNVLIIHTDEHNFRTLGCYRKLLSKEQAYVWGKGVAVETPHIDRIAAEGVTCTGFYATTPVCSPSRSSFVSGRYPQNTPVVKNDIPMNDDIVTFAEILRRNGYATGYAGKWHLDGTGKPQWAPKRQFGFADNRYMFNRGHWKKLEDTPDGPRVAAKGKKGRPGYGVDGADGKSFTTDFLTQKVIDFITANKTQPFCYMVSLPDPHGPNSVRAPYDTMYSDLPFQLPKTATKPDTNLPSWAKKAGAAKMKTDLMAKYFGMVKCIDDNVGKLLKTLDTLGLAENTIVVFTADHGDLCFEHARHNKGVPLETSAKIPFVMRAPGKIQPGTVSREAMGCVDFMPTILTLTGHKCPTSVEGRDCSRLLTSEKAPAGWKDIAFFRGTGDANDNWFGAVTQRYKLIYAAKDKPWLYDLKNDPDELVNFYHDPGCADVVRNLSQALIDYGKKYNDPRVLDAANMSQLRKATS